MVRVRVVQREDGGVSVIRAAGERAPLGVLGPDGVPLLESAEAYEARVFEQAQAGDPLLAGRPFRDIDEADLPPRADRDAWRLSGDAVVVEAES